MSLVRFLCATSLICFVCLKKKCDTHYGMEWDGMEWDDGNVPTEIRTQDTGFKVPGAKPLHYRNIFVFVFVFLLRFAVDTHITE